MKKYIRICACCGNTFETDMPAFHIAADGAVYRTNSNMLCKPCNKDFIEGKIKPSDFKIKMTAFRLKLPRPQG